MSIGQIFRDFVEAHVGREDMMHMSFPLWFSKLTTGEPRMVARIAWEEVPDDGMVYVEPTLRLNPLVAQQLMDRLYQAGIRPTEQVDSAGELKAAKDHLEDLRSLVFGEDKIPPKPRSR